MRYHRLNSRYYTLIVTTSKPASFYETWRPGRWKMSKSQCNWQPPADIYETKERIYLTIELAGINLEELDILLYEDALIIKGERQVELKEDNGIYYAAEICQGAFCFELPLVAIITPEQINIIYDRGLLCLTITKTTGG